MSNSVESSTVPSASRGLRVAAFFTMAVTGPYPIVLVGAVLLSEILTGSVFPDLTTDAGLAYAGQFPTAVKLVYLSDGLAHVLLFVTFVAVFAVIRARWPVHASLTFVGAAWQLITGVTKAITSVYMVTSLGTSYLVANDTGKAALLPLGGVVAGLRQGLQDMDTYGLVFVWVLIALLPKETGIPRWVRWLAWMMVVAEVVPFDLGPLPFFLVSALLPIWCFLLGRWLKQQATVAAR